MGIPVHRITIISMSGEGWPIDGNGVRLENFWQNFLAEVSALCLR